MKTCLIVALLTIAVPALAADQTSATTALTAADQSEALAGSLGNRWIPAEAALKAARAALAKQDWDTTLTEATRAKALADRAVEQAREQKTLWRDAVIR